MWQGDTATRLGVAFGALAHDRPEDLKRGADAEVYRVNNKVKGRQSLPNCS